MRRASVWVSLWALLMAGCLDSSDDGGDGATASGGSGSGGTTGGTRPDGTGSTTGAGTTSSGTGSSGASGGTGTSGANGGTDTGGTGGNTGSGSETGGTGGAASSQQCPPECLRAYTCAATCDDEPFNNGCCPCPEGTIDTITCPNNSGGGCGEGAPGCGELGAACCDPSPCDSPSFCHDGLSCCGSTCAESCEGDGAGGYCAVGCTGAAPDPGVESACLAITTQQECTSYATGGFPSSCAWITAGSEPCLAP